jgi:uncharacterized protein (DUF736 family)
MTDYDDTNRGVLFQNDKGENPARPDYRGTINVDGRELDLAGWKRTSAKGVRFLSLNVSEKRDRAPSEHEANRQLYGKVGKPDHARAASHDSFEDSEIPF